MLLVYWQRQIAMPTLEGKQYQKNRHFPQICVMRRSILIVQRGKQAYSMYQRRCRESSLINHEDYIMKTVNRKEATRKVKAAKGLKVKTSLRAGTGFTNRDTYGSEYGTY